MCVLQRAYIAIERNKNDFCWTQFLANSKHSTLSRSLSLALSVCSFPLSASEFESLNISSTKWTEKNCFFSSFNCFCYCTSSKLRRHCSLYILFFFVSGGFFLNEYYSWAHLLTHTYACSNATQHNITHSISKHSKHNRFVSPRRVYVCLKFVCMLIHIWTVCICTRTRC